MRQSLQSISTMDDLPRVRCADLNEAPKELK
jgi:hypothetical protein